MSDYSPPGYTPSAAPGGRSKGRERKPTKRSAAVTRWLFLGFAGVLALLVVLLLTSRNPVTYEVRTENPVQALQELTPENLVAVPTDPKYVEPNSFTGSSPEAALQAAEEFASGKWLIYPLAKGQVVRSENFSSIGELAIPLAPDERLISVGARAARAVAGAVRPGDRVDVLVADSQGLSGVLGEDIEVVGVSITPEQFDSVAAAQLEDPNLTLSGAVPPAPIPGTYVLRVKVSDVAKYVAADTSGRLFLALRGKGATTPTTLQPADLFDAICAGVEASESCLRSGSADSGIPAE